MNARIKELSDKCGLAWTLKTEQDVKNLVEFAELIIQECCQFNYDFNESYREACEVNAKIREHFGVE